MSTTFTLISLILIFISIIFLARNMTLNDINYKMKILKLTEIYKVIFIILILDLEHRLRHLKIQHNV